MDHLKQANLKVLVQLVASDDRFGSFVCGRFFARNSRPSSHYLQAEALLLLLPNFAGWGGWWSILQLTLRPSSPGSALMLIVGQNFQLDGWPSSQRSVRQSDL